MFYATCLVECGMIKVMRGADRLVNRILNVNIRFG